MIEFEIYPNINGFLKWKISKDASYIEENKKVTGKICILNLRNKIKSIFATVIIRYQEKKKMTKEAGELIVKSTYKLKNSTMFVHFRSTIDKNRSRT